MTRSEVTVNDMAGIFAAAETPDTIDKTSDHVIDAEGDKLLLLFHLTAATSGDTITIKAGVNPPAFRSGIGDLVYTSAGLGAEETADIAVGPIESARFKQSDGKIYVDVAGATIAGTLEAYALP